MKINEIILQFLSVKPTEKNEVSLAGEPKSDPTLLTSAPKNTTETKPIDINLRNSRLLAQSSPNMVVPPTSSSPVLLQLGGTLRARSNLVNATLTPC